MKTFLCLFAAIASWGAFGYVDEYVSVDDDTVVRRMVDGRAVYVFTTTSTLQRKLTLRQPMVLSQYLVVGGGVVYENSAQLVLANGAVLSALVGAGGARGTSGTVNVGGNSLLSVPGIGTIMAYGGGGGGSWTYTANTGASTGGATSNVGKSVQPVIATDPPQGNLGGACCAPTGNGIGGGGGGYSESGQASYETTRDILDGDDNVLIEGQVYYQGGKGGDGLACEITGERHVYGSGGGGAAGWANLGGRHAYNLPGEGGEESGGRGGHTTLDHGNTDLSGVDGVNGLGGGGGGAGHNNNLSVAKNAGNGGSGTVIVALRPPAPGDKVLAVDPIGIVIYTGEEQRPAIVVRDVLSGEAVDGSKYAATYTNNIDTGVASVKVVGQGEYAGTTSIGEFRIVHPRRSGSDVYLFLGGANMCASAAAGGPAAAISNIMANAEAGAAPVVLNAAVAASKFTTWVKGGVNYDAAVAAATAAEEAGGSVRAIFWMQGEEDASDAEVRGNYAALLAEMAANLRVDLALDDSIPFIAATLPETSSTGVNNCRALNESLRTLPDHLAYSAVVESRDLLLNGYNVKTLCAESTRTLGLRMANAFFELERRYANGRLAVGELGPQAISGGDQVAPAVAVTDTDGTAVAPSDYEVDYRGVSEAGFGVAVVVGKEGTAYANMTNFAPFRLMRPVFAAPDGDAEKDGSSWGEATTFERAVELANGTNEVWLKKGTYARDAVFNMTVAMFLRGGFEGNAGDRLDGEYSVFDGGGTASGIFGGTHTGNPAADAYKTLIERIDFRGATGTLVYRPGSGCALVRDCRFSGAKVGIDSSSAYGRQNLAVRGCRFTNIILPNTTWGSGVPISIGNVANALVEDCQFVSNGVPWTHAIPSSTLHGKGRMISVVNCVPFDVIGCEFRANRMTASVGNGSACINITTTPSRRLRIERCLFVGNELVGRTKTDGQWGGAKNANADSGMVVLYAYDSNYTLDLLDCTFAYNTIDNGSAAAVSVITGKLNVRNTIFFGNISSSDNLTGSDLVLQANRDDWYASADIAYSLFAEDSEKFFFAGRSGQLAIDRQTMVFGDPLFVTPMSAVTNLLRNTTAGSATASATRWRSNFAFTADSQDKAASFDCHLRSAAGTRLNDGSWTNFAGVTSIALDKGDPRADFRREPAPNGSRINLGYYGGTPSASKTMEAFPGLENDTIGIEFPDGVSQPQLDFTVIDTHGGAFSAEMTVYVGTEDGWTVTNSYPGVAANTPFHIVVPDCYQAGKTLKVRVVIVASGKTATFDAEQEVEGSPSPYYNVGGGAGVFHVRPGAMGRGDGSDWFHAFAGDIHDAVRFVADQELSGVSEMWCAIRTNTLSVLKAAPAPAYPLVIRGGFEGLETEARQRQGWRTLCESGGTRTPMSVANTVPLAFERFEFTGAAAGRGFMKTGAGNLTLEDCRFFGNVKSGAVDGRGVHATGNAASTVLTITNCVFEGNTNTDLGSNSDTTSGSGGALYVSGFRRVVIDDSLFLTNGLVWYCSHPKSGNSSIYGSTIYAVNAPLTVRRTAFRANRGGTSRNVGQGGIVSLAAGTAGSCFTNCLFVGNHESWHQGSGPGPYGGALKVNTGDTNTFVDVVNCTFFGNLVDGTSLAAGLNVVSGAALVENSVFSGNLLGASRSGAYAEDMVVAADARAEVRYTLFGSESSVLNQDGGTLVLGDGVIYGDAKLATPLAELEGVTQQSDSCTVFKPGVRAAVLGWDVHPRSPAGTWSADGNAWTNYENDVSRALDGGDPSADYGLEPTPNGYRVNLGCYGNTPEASKSQVANPAILNDQIDVVFLDGYSQPQIDFTVIDTEGGFFSAVATVYISTGGVETVAGSVVDVQPGQHVSITAYDFYVEGDMLDIRVVVEASGMTAQATCVEEVTGGFPPWYGKGGGASIIHVRPGAKGRKDGTNWQDAYDCDLHTAFNYISETRSEIWFAGATNLLTEPKGAWTLSRASTVRGGFTGVENSPGERPEGSVTVVDAGYRSTALAVRSDRKDLLLERLSFERGAPQGFTINVGGPSAGAMAGDTTLVDCRFVANGQRTKGTVSGRGGQFWGCYNVGARSDGTATLTLRNCEFVDNHAEMSEVVDNWTTGIGGAQMHIWKQVVLDGCVFSGNGLKYDMAYGVCGCVNPSPTALSVDSAPVTARNCRFLRHRGFTAGTGSGVVALGGGCGGSAFTNCLWCGNCDYWRNNQGDGNQGGVLRIETGDLEHAVDVVNCTIFANVGNGCATAAGINVVSGALSLRNSILFANTLGAHKNVAAADLAVKDGARADVAYTLFTDPSTVTNGASGVLSLGEGVFYGDARLATSYATVTNHVLLGDFESGNKAKIDISRAEDIAAYNVHLRGLGGYTDETTGRKVGLRFKSPAIDAGDPAMQCVEPKPNGNRVNLGFYGNTPWATLTHSGGMLVVR